MTHGSLFSGIGGFDLAAEWMGWENVFHCEINPFGQQVLNYYWPNSISYDDITKTDFTIHRGTIDVLTGGFPCQPYSQAGKRLGKEDDRHLWPYMLRAIQQIKPRWIVGENVFGITNWNGGLVFNEVQADLEAEGYEVQPYILPAVSVNAPHRRDRVWFVAYRNGMRRTQEYELQQSELYKQYGEGRIAPNPRLQRQEISTEQTAGIEQCDKDFTTDTDINIGYEGGMHKTRSIKTTRYISPHNARINQCSTWHNFPTQPPVRSRNDGISTGLVGITVPKHRNESIKAYGNAIVPQVVLQIFKAIEEYEKL